MNFIVITPAYNEDKYIERTIKSVIKQSILPKEWIIVDDGSTDKTATIIKHYSKKYSWIKYILKNNSNYKFGEHAVRLFYFGLKHSNTKNYKYIMKLDSDLDIDGTHFFEYQLNQFKSKPKLGICSGLTYSIKHGEKILTKDRPYWHTGGAMKFYRRKCLNDIGGLDPILGWDGIDEYKAMYRGWKTRTFFNLHVNHLGKKRAINRSKQNWLAFSSGKSFYQRGYPLEFILTRFMFLFIKFKLNRSIHFLYGYIKSYLNRIDKVVNKEEKKYIRKFQYKRLLDKFTRKKLL